MSMVASHLIWKLRTRRLQKLAKEAGQTFDENPECREWQAKGIDLEGPIRRLFSKKIRTGDERDLEDSLRNPPVEPQHIHPKTGPVAVV